MLYRPIPLLLFRGISISNIAVGGILAVVAGLIFIGIGRIASVVEGSTDHGCSILWVGFMLF